MGFDPFVNYATMNALGMIFLRIFEDAYFKHKELAMNFTCDNGIESLIKRKQELKN